MMGLQVSDRQKIGVLLIALGLLFMFLGFILFLDAGLMTIGNVLFLTGWPFIGGLQLTLSFFNPFQFWEQDWLYRLRGKALFWVGVVLVLARWPLVGILLELVGLLLMFGRFLGTAVAAAKQVPILQQILELPVVSSVVAAIAAPPKRRPPV